MKNISCLVPVNTMVNFMKMFGTHIMKNISCLVPVNTKSLTLCVNLKIFWSSVLAHLMFQSETRSILGFSGLIKTDGACLHMCQNK